MPNDMRMLIRFAEGEAVNIGGKDYIVSQIREDSGGSLQVTFDRKPFLTKRPEDSR